MNPIEYVWLERGIKLQYFVYRSIIVTTMPYKFVCVCVCMLKNGY